MTPPWRAQHIVALFLIVLGAGALIACEPRIEEPSASPRSTADAARSSAPVCPRPSPSVAQRVVKGPVPDPRCPADDGTPPKLKLGAVRFPGAQGGEVEVAVEIAEKDQDRQRGLMFRKSMPETSGMLFVFDQQKEMAFWMKNTCIPLDMIFVSEDGTIVGIEENTPTLSLDTFSPGCPSKYVIETNAGFTRKHGILSGQKVNLVL